MKHLRFIAKTALVQNGEVDAAVKALNGVLKSENIVKTFKLWQTYEKPTVRRNRLAFEKCISIYNQEMDRKIRFLVRKSRENPYPWD